MDQDLKTKWLEALRSGEYQQGMGRLFDEHTDTYCCLGVLVKIQGADLTSGNKCYAADYDDVPTYGEQEYPEEEHAAGIEYDAMANLADMNDGAREYTGKRHSFAELADHIEAHL